MRFGLESPPCLMIHPEAEWVPTMAELAIAEGWKYILTNGKKAKEESTQFAYIYLVEKLFVRFASTISIYSATSAIAGRLSRSIGGMRSSNIIVQKNRKIAFEKKLLAREASGERAERSRRRKKWDYYKGIGPKGMFVDSFLPVFILYIFLVFWYGFYRRPSRSVPMLSIQFRWFIWTSAHKHHNVMEIQFYFLLFRLIIFCIHSFCYDCYSDPFLLPHHHRPG